MTPDEIIKAACRAMGTTPETVRQRSRRRELVHYRVVLAVLLKEKTYLTLRMIARLLGLNDHSTVCHMLQSATDYPEETAALQARARRAVSQECAGALRLHEAIRRAVPIHTLSTHGGITWTR